MIQGSAALAERLRRERRSAAFFLLGTACVFGGLTLALTAPVALLQLWGMLVTGAGGLLFSGPGAIDPARIGWRLLGLWLCGSLGVGVGLLNVAYAEMLDTAHRHRVERWGRRVAALDALAIPVALAAFVFLLRSG